MSQITSAPNRVVYLDRLRVFAAFAVVLIHVSASAMSASELLSENWYINCLFDCLARWSVPVFFMISGAMMLSKDRPIRSLFRKNILRIVLVLAVWSLVYAAADIFKGMNLHDAVIRFLSGHYHLWYLFAIIGLYLITPFLRKIAEHPSLELYFLLLAFMFAILIPQILNVWEVYHSEPVAFLRSETLGNLDFHFTLGFVGYYMLGHYLFFHPLRRDREWIVCLLGAMSLLCGVLMTGVLSARCGQISDTFLEYNSVNVLFEAIAVFSVFQNHFDRIAPNRCSSILNLSSCTLGVYLIHLLFLENISIFYGIQNRFPALIATPAVALGTAMLSFVAVWLISKIPVLKKLV